MKNMFTLILFLMLIPIMAITMYGQYKYNKGEFDEMQEHRRSIAYKKAFFSVMVIIIGYMFYDLLLADYFIHLSALFLACICLTVGVSVFNAYCILNDAYYYVGENHSSKFSLFVFLIICFLEFPSLKWISISEIFPIENGTISVSFDSLNLFLSVFFFTMAVALCIKQVKEKRARVSEEN